MSETETKLLNASARDIIETLRGDPANLKTWKFVAKRLNREGIRTRRGVPFTDQTVREYAVRDGINVVIKGKGKGWTRKVTRRRNSTDAVTSNDDIYMDKPASPSTKRTSELAEIIRSNLSTDLKIKLLQEIMQQK